MIGQMFSGFASANPERRWGRVCQALMLASFVLLIILIATSPAKLLYDEPEQLEAVTLIKQHGVQYALTQTASTSGPLYAIIHLVLMPLTGLEAPWVRLVNLCFLAATILIVWLSGRELKIPSPEFSACSLMAIAYIWPPAGLALTELPALFFFALWTYLNIKLPGREQIHGEQISLGQMALAGLCLGIASLGRQIYLAPIIALVVLGTSLRRNLVRLFVQGIIVAFTVGWVFYIWGDIVPPRRSISHSSLRFDYGLLSLAYAAIAVWFIAPHWYLERKRSLFVVALAGCIIGFIFHPVMITPARTLSERLLPATLFAIYPMAISAVLTGIAVFWLCGMVGDAWTAREDRRSLFIYVALFLVAITPVAISHQYSSRYTAAAASLFPLAFAASARPSFLTVLTSCVGVSLGIGILLSYYRLI